MSHMHDAPLLREHARPQLFERAEHSYYAEVKSGQLDEQSSIIDGLIGLAFETLGAHHLDLRVIDAQLWALEV
jgi:hypothetical protein